jgi:2-polyprenyl-6-methoxyphenol hydroxylase-like FAD-dependent oxidoreductase
VYKKILIIDRDDLPVGPSARRGVPQGRQLHVLLARGRQTFEELFPGLCAELGALGAPMVDLHGEVDWYNDGFRMRRAPSPLIAVGISRPLLEGVLRTRVMALPGVEVRTTHEVLGLITTPDRGRVTGVRVRPVAAGSEEYSVETDLVVDTGGRGTRTPVWLEQLGYRPAVEEKVKVDVTYVTRIYRREPHHLDGHLGLLTNAVPGRPRTGIMAAQEDGQIAIALSGVLGERPPTDDAGFLEFAESLAAPQVAQVLRSAEPLTGPATMFYPASIRRRYERLRRFPERYLVMGDAMCSFNPIYGQGMTVAAQEARLLRRLVAQGSDGLARRFFRGAAKVIDTPWSIAVGTDLRFPEVTGRRTLQVRFVNAYIHRLHGAATTDPVLGAAFLRVLNLVDPPTKLLAPRIIMRVLFGSRGTASSPGVASRAPVRLGDPDLDEARR